MYFGTLEETRRVSHLNKCMKIDSLGKNKSRYRKLRFILYCDLYSLPKSIIQKIFVFYFLGEFE